MFAAGCGPDPNKPVEVVIERPVKLCPYHLPVCAYWSPPSGGANPLARPPAGAADRAWEKFQEMLHFRPDNAAFRMMGGILNTQFANWQDMIVLEYIDRPAGAKMDELNYAFMVLARIGGGFYAMTNFLHPDQFDFDLKARPIKLDAELSEQCFATLQTASESLPSALVWQSAEDSPVIVVHYLSETGKPWACAVRDKESLPAILGLDTAILKKEASNTDVHDVLGKRDASGRMVQQEYADAACGPADRERYEKVRDRYTSIISGVWAISVGQIKQEQPRQPAARHGDDQHNKPATTSATKPKIAPSTLPGTPIAPAESRPSGQPATAVRAERPISAEPQTKPATTSPAAGPSDGAILKAMAGKSVLVLVEGRPSDADGERIQAGLTDAMNKKLAGRKLCRHAVEYKKLKEFRESAADYGSMRIGQIGQKLSADVVLYVRITDSRVKSSQNLWQGRLEAEVKIVDSGGKRLWPAEPSTGKAVKPAELSAADNSSSDYSARFVEELAGRLAESVIALLGEADPAE